MKKFDNGEEVEVFTHVYSRWNTSIYAGFDESKEIHMVWIRDTLVPIEDVNIRKHQSLPKHEKTTIEKFQEEFEKGYDDCWQTDNGAHWLAIEVYDHLYDHAYGVIEREEAKDYDTVCDKNDNLLKQLKEKEAEISELNRVIMSLTDASLNALLEENIITKLTYNNAVAESR